MHSKFAPGQRVKFNFRCVLAGNVQRHSGGYTHAVLRLADDDKYPGDGVIEPGPQATIVDYASHGTGSADNPIVRVLGKLARCHQDNLAAV